VEQKVTCWVRVRGYKNQKLKRRDVKRESAPRGGSPNNHYKINRTYHLTRVKF